MSRRINRSNRNIALRPSVAVDYCISNSNISLNGMNGLRASGGSEWVISRSAAGKPADGARVAGRNETMMSCSRPDWRRHEKECAVQERPGSSVPLAICFQYQEDHSD